MLHVSDELLKEIGRIAVLQAHIEGGLASVIASLANVEYRVGDALVKPLSFQTLAQIASSLLALRAADLGEHGTRATALLQRARTAEQRRNEIVHSMWSFGPHLDPNVASRIKLSGVPPELKGHAVPVEDIRALVSEMSEILAEVIYIHPLLRLEPKLTR